MSQTPPISVRPAEPTVEQGLVFARHLDAAAEGFMRILLGRRMPELVAEAYTHPRNEYSFENVLAAEREGRIVGMAAGFGIEERRTFSTAPLKQAAGFPHVRYALAGLCFWPLFRILTRIPAGDFYVLAIATDAEVRGSGAGSHLMDAMEERARERGFQRIALDVALKNEGARRFYERRGMVVESRWPRRFLPTVLLRMTKPVA